MEKSAQEKRRGNTTFQTFFAWSPAAEAMHQGAGEAAALEGTGNTVIDVRNTVFKVVPTDDGFAFTVVDIIYR